MSHGDTLQALGNEIIELVNATQREINREFSPAVQAAMEQAYAHCAAEGGTGMFMRIKAYMAEYVEHKKRDLFETAVKEVKSRLLKMINQVRDRMEEDTMLLYNGMQRDYHSIFGGQAQDFTGGHGRIMRDLKDGVKESLVGFEEPFRELVGVSHDDGIVRSKRSAGSDEDLAGSDEEADSDEEAGSNEETTTFDEGPGKMDLDGKAGRHGKSRSCEPIAQDEAGRPILGETRANHSTRSDGIKGEESDDDFAPR